MTNETLSDRVEEAFEKLDLILIITFIISLPGLILMVIGMGLDRIGFKRLGPAIGGIGFFMALAFIVVTGMGEN